MQIFYVDSHSKGLNVMTQRLFSILDPMLRVEEENTHKTELKLN